MWDDHGCGANDSYGFEADGTPVAYRQARLGGYRELVPHPDLASEGADSPIYYHVDIDRVRLVVCDGRSARHIKTKPDDGTKSMRGPEQVASLKGQFDWLAANQDRAIIWANSMPWRG